METLGSFTRTTCTALLVLFLLSAAPPARIDHLRSAGDSAASDSLLQFISNGHVLGFRSGEFYLANATHALRVEFLDANRVAPNSYTHNPPISNPSISQSLNLSIPTPFTRVTYANLWDGITLAYDADRGGIVSSSYRLEPRADPRAIRLRYNAPVALRPDGALIVTYDTGQIIESAPIAWQEINGARVPVPVRFAVRDAFEEHAYQVGFEVDSYDLSQPLFIDPTISWNTFLGGTGLDSGVAMAIDSSGYIYVAGTSNATWGSPVITYTNSTDTFAAKLNSSGTLVWHSFLGGAGADYAGDIAVDGNGNVYIAGDSTVAWGTPLRAYTSGGDAFAAKLNSSGALTWSTFLGGSEDDTGTDVKLDTNGNVYVSGQSLETWGSPVRAYTGLGDGFVAQLTAGGALTWNTFLGGAGGDGGYGIATEGTTSVYIVGLSTSSWQNGVTPPVRAFTSSLTDCFLAKLNSGGDIQWNTFLGGSGTDICHDVAVDPIIFIPPPPLSPRGVAGPSATGNVYVAGYSTATWQGSASPVRSYSSGDDSFAAKLNSTTGALTWNSFLGGSGTDQAYGVIVDSSGNLYLAGYSSATWALPVHGHAGANDAFAVKVASNGALVWNTFLGQIAHDYGNDIARAGNGTLYLVGGSFGTWGSPIRAFSSNSDAFVTTVTVSQIYLPFIIR